MSNAIDRFLEAARVLDHPVEVRRFPEGTKTAAAASISRTGFGWALRAIASAPTSEPMPMNESREPSVPASPWKTSSAISGISTEKLNENVKMTAITTSGARSSGVLHT